MAHESFEDPQIAAVMNEQFVNVKVDREERPDVDAVYMQAVQAMTGSGGWPMTVFLDPDGRPFYGGTYFPPDDRQGMPGFVRLMDAVSEAWREPARRPPRAGRAAARGDRGEHDASAPAVQRRGATADLVAHARSTSLREQFDPRFGGFGGRRSSPRR